MVPLLLLLGLGWLTYQAITVWELTRTQRRSKRKEQH